MSTSKRLLACDPEIAACIQREASRQQQTLTLIAAETVTSTAVQEALRAPLSEISIDDSCSQPHERHSGGPLGGAEEPAASRAKGSFGAEHVKSSQFQQRPLHHIGRPHEGEHRPVVIDVTMDIDEVRSASLHRVGKVPNNGRISPLTDVGHALDQRAP
jgi:Serine hydroxymethyltransferase